MHQAMALIKLKQTFSGGVIRLIIFTNKLIILHNECVLKDILKNGIQAI